MKQWAPGRVELAILVGMALVGSLIVAMSHNTPAALSLAGMPVFLIASLLGHRRYGNLRREEADGDDLAA